MTRIILTGGPKVGKTTRALEMAQELGCPYKGTDSLMKSHDWSEASEEVSHWFDQPGDWVIEGVAAPRALRKWLERNKRDLSKSPCDRIYFSSKPFCHLTPGQIAMTKGLQTVWSEIRYDLLRRGVQILPF